MPQFQCKICQEKIIIPEVAKPGGELLACPNKDQYFVVFPDKRVIEIENKCLDCGKPLTFDHTVTPAHLKDGIVLQCNECRYLMLVRLYKIQERPKSKSSWWNY